MAEELRTSPAPSAGEAAQSKPASAADSAKPISTEKEPPRYSMIDEWKQKAKRRRGVRIAMTIATAAATAASITVTIVVAVAGAANNVRKKNQKKKK